MGKNNILEHMDVIGAYMLSKGLLFHGRQKVISINAGLRHTSIINLVILGSE